MNFCGPVAFIAIFLLICQTVFFGIAHRACEFGLDFPSQFRHNTRTVINSGKHNVTLSDCNGGATVLLRSC